MSRRYTALRFIRDFIQANGYCPELREIAAGIGLSRGGGTVHFHVRKLREEGLVQWLWRQPRTIHLTPAGEAWLWHRYRM